MMLRTLCAFGLLTLSLVPSGAFARPGFTAGALPGGDSTVPTLFREAIVSPARYRVVFIPGSGCAGMGPIADRYFRGLIHAEVLVLHKPGVNLMAGPAPGDCTPDFIRWDALSRWSTAARIALQADAQSHSRLPRILVGASEGAEILPLLSEVAGDLHALVMISSSGLDPREAGDLQARRLGAESAWRDLGVAVASAESDDSIHQGRTLKYWRDLWTWRLTNPLLKSAVPVMQVWGSADASVPASAYAQFAELAAGFDATSTSSGHICIHRLDGANHGLQSPGRDGVQWLWAQLERWARTPDSSPCALTNS
jgi:hypothetical protein